MSELVIEDIPVENIQFKRTGFAVAVFKLKPGQSFLYHKSLNTAYRLIRACKDRHMNPLRGEFKVVREGDKVRVGRVA